MKLYACQRVLCVCRGGQVRSVAARSVLHNHFGFRKVIAAGWETNDEVTIDSLCGWADAVVIVGRGADWKASGLVSTPVNKTLYVEVGPDVWGRYDHPELLATLLPKLKALM